MPSIGAYDVNIHYPLTERGVYSGPSRPKNMVDIGSKKYILALRNVSFEIAEGQRVGIIGRNGSGKSTLLRVMGKIYMPTSGTLVTQGAISSMFNLALGSQADATGRENILIRGLIKGWSRREIRSRTPEIIEYSELGDFIDLPMRTYSDGMRMRLLFAIATSFSPEILLLDEWIGAGDAKFQKKAAERMNGLVDQSGITVIASHNRNLLRNVCDLGMWLDYGVVRAFGKIDEVYNEMDNFFAKSSA
ncbi:MAG: ABC transporter ATP-binding protein [Alphaproteobacteria bacterium]|nr:ABC transporter ATP-binding protein [Alphaproteobacteria bacterium]